MSEHSASEGPTPKKERVRERPAGVTPRKNLMEMTCCSCILRFTATRSSTFPSLASGGDTKHCSVRATALYVIAVGWGTYASFW